jgi:hypothetical protein
MKVRERHTALVRFVLFESPESRRHQFAGLVPVGSSFLTTGDDVLARLEPRDGIRIGEPPFSTAPSGPGIRSAS